MFLVAGLLAITGALLTGCGSKKKNAEEESVIKISTAPEPTATPDPKTVDPDAVTSNGNLTMVNEYLAENGSEALGIDGVTPTPAASSSPPPPPTPTRWRQSLLRPAVMWRS